MSKYNKLTGALTTGLMGLVASEVMFTELVVTHVCILLGSVVSKAPCVIIKNKHGKFKLGKN